MSSIKPKAHPFPCLPGDVESLPLASRTKPTDDGSIADGRHGATIRLGGRILAEGHPFARGTFGKVSLVREGDTYQACKTLVVSASGERLRTATRLTRPRAAMREIAELTRAGVAVQAFRTTNTAGTKSRVSILLPVKSMSLRALGKELVKPVGSGQFSAEGRTATCLWIAKDWFDWLTKLHADHRLHHDVQASNFMLSVEGHIDLADMGNVDRPLDKPLVQYTEDHRAPEVGRIPHDTMAEFWSWSLALGHALTGSRPWVDGERKKDFLAERDENFIWWALSGLDSLTEAQAAAFNEHIGRNPDWAQYNKTYDAWYCMIKRRTNGTFAQLLRGIWVVDLDQRREAVMAMADYLQNDPCVPTAPHPELLAFARQSYDALITAHGPGASVA